MMKPKLNINTNSNNGISILNTNNPIPKNSISKPLSSLYNLFNKRKHTLRNNSSVYLYTLPPINLRIISLCLIWYFISSLTSQLTKTILTDFNFPIFIGECQFCISALLSISLIIVLINFPWLINHFPKNSVPVAFIQQTNLIINNQLYSSNNSNNSNLINNIIFLQKSVYNLPNLFDKNVFRSILPMGFFQFFGKLFSLAATAAVPIATVASIRSLSPLLIVAGYRIYYKVRFPISTYLSLIPLVLGVVIIVISQAKDHSKSLSHSITTSAVVGSLDNNDSSSSSLSTTPDTEAAAAANAAAADAAIAAANSAMTAVVEAGTSAVIKILNNKRDSIDPSQLTDNLISSSSDPQVVTSAKLASITDYPALYMNFSDYLKGLIYASSSALIFAIQSIYAKNIMSTSDLFVNDKHNNKHHNIQNNSFVTTNNNDQPHQQHPVNKFKFRSNSTSMPSPGSLSLPNTVNNKDKLDIDSDILLDEKLSSQDSSLEQTQFPNTPPPFENFIKPFPTLTPLKSSSNLSDYENKNELLLNDNKPDKLTVLLYCAIFGFSLSFPIFMIYEFPSLVFGKKLIVDNELINDTLFKIPWGLLILNGFSHFCQALLAFHILGSLPTVTYSIANLMKRIIIMTVSMIMTGKQLTFNEFLGLLHIAVGLYAYDKWGSHKR